MGRTASLRPEDLVIGVTINRESKAYPIGPLNFREMVSDVVGGVPVLVTWCPLCYTGLVHDRRAGGRTHSFGNQGALFKGAMTWYDHQTFSVWSQPWGRAIFGPLKGTQLKLIPASILPWGTWLADHPDTMVLELDGLKYGDSRAEFRAGYVVGVTLGEHAKAYPFRVTSQMGVVNDRVGPFPVMVSADAESKAVHVYLRKVGDRN